MYEQTHFLTLLERETLYSHNQKIMFMSNTRSMTETLVTTTPIVSRHLNLNYTRQNKNFHPVCLTC